MRVLVCAAGTRGDLHPLVGVAAALRGRGHEVYLLANPAYAALAEEAQVAFHPVGTREDLDRLTSQPKAWTYAHGWKLWLKGAGVAPMRELYRAIESLVRRDETLVVASYLCFGARVARERLRIPTATVHLNVHTIRTIYGVHAYPPPPLLPDCLPRNYLLPEWSSVWYRSGALNCADRFFIDPLLKREIEAFRNELGLPRIEKPMRVWWNSPDLVMGLFPSWWAGSHPDWPRVVMTGFPLWDRSDAAPLPSSLRQFLLGEKVLVYTPGASLGHSQKHFTAFERSCERLGRRGLILTSSASREPASKRVRFERYVPFRSLFPRAAAVVHQAGIGTSALCLAAGLPQVVAPTVYNNPDTAIRLERLGVARQVSAQRFSERTLTPAIQRQLESADVAANCEKYARLVQQTDAPPRACSELEQLAAARGVK